MIDVLFTTCLQMLSDQVFRNKSVLEWRVQETLNWKRAPQELSLSLPTFGVYNLNTLRVLAAHGDSSNYHVQR